MSGQIFFNRHVRLTIGDNSDTSNAILIGKDGADFRIDFTVEKTRDSTINKAIIQVFNLSSDLRNRADSDWNRITLVAGYEGDTKDVDDSNSDGFWGVIFDGWANKVQHRRNSDVDIITTFTCVDGGTAYENAIVRDTWSSGDSYRGIVRDIVNTMGGDRDW